PVARPRDGDGVALEQDEHLAVLGEADPLAGVDPQLHPSRMTGGSLWRRGQTVKRLTSSSSSPAVRASWALDAATSSVDALDWWAEAETCSVEALASVATAATSSVALAMRSMQLLTSVTLAARPSKASRVWPTVWAADSASLRTSSATTAKPRPCSPARAASI